jgi:hypothetical protein
MGDGIPLGFNSGCGRADHFAGGGMGMSGRDGFPQEINIRRAFCTPHSAFPTWQALQFQGVGGEGAGGHAEKLKLGKQKAEIASRRAQRSAAPSCPRHLPVPCALISHFSFQLSRFQVLSLLSAFRFQVSAFQGFSFLLRGQSSNVRWVCCWRELVLVRHRTKWLQTAGRCFFTDDRVTLWVTRLRREEKV